MKRFSSSTAFLEAVDSGRWSTYTITEGDFSAVVMSNVNLTWIQLPGLQLRDATIISLESKVTVSADSPPRLTVEKSVKDDGTSDDGQAITKKFKFLDIEEVQVISSTACVGQGWILVHERRCIKITKSPQDGYGVAVMRSQRQRRVEKAIVKVGGKEYLFCHFHRWKTSVDWNKISANGVFEIGLQDVVLNT
ncbi:unnamed protein product [Didymodactylos carnosus]|uniref:Uncharacterized protein n=1 Tax=Didymodactylos carnosus TaxID=1234261 RepID=A0A814MY81_9BILA|nr:unnamed protein product [Didymodactylos carnosus]CAF1085378.1 unnamed protein product [Didymodactylos carnosus]CAF3679417.1 unnamed protein product [Didymodactylos carnosus]CAF3850972.1 unnamed protein product [Didymodactylos carnosus]